MKNLNIGIITIVHVNNYGAELQAFALQKKLNMLGFNAEIINYLFYKNPKFKKTKKSQPFTKLTLSQKIKEFLYPYVKSIKSIPYYKQKQLRDKKFSDFHKKYTKQSQVYNSIDALYKAQFKYDVYIVGSDQVWNPNTNTNIEPYFLTFAPKNSLKLSYASSFGVNSIKDNDKPYYKKLLDNLSFISVREKSGVQIVQETANKNGTWVVDPTFLLSKTEWSEFSVQPNINEPYLLMYVLTDSNYIANLARQIAKEKGLKIVRICKNAFVEDTSADVLNIVDAGPEDYVGLFSKASFVITTSFHGTCFSVNFNKPFYTVLKKNKLNNSRQIDLLNDLGIEDRILYVDDAYPENKDINFTDVNYKLKAKINESVAFLDNAINS